MPLPPAHLLAVGSLRPDPGPARSWLERELSRPVYDEGLADRVLGWLQGLWEALRSTALDASPLSTAAAVVVVVVLLVLLGLVVSRLRREPPRADGGAAVLVTGGVSPDDHRAAAQTALDEGAFDRALVAAFRALATRAVRRGVVDERPGLTAHELADDLVPAFPEQADAVRRASVLFDQVFYGDRPATADQARSVLDLDDTLRTVRPARRGEGAAPPPTAAVPR